MPKTKLNQSHEKFQLYSLKELISQILNLLAVIERKIYLEEHPEDRANGFFPRTLTAGSLSLELNIPRVRTGSFRPFFLPEKWKRHVPGDYINLITALLFSSKSIESAKMALREMNIPVSEEYMSNVINDLKEEMEVINNSQLDPDWFALIMDAKEVKIKVKDAVKRYTLFFVLGITLSGHKKLLVAEVSEGKEGIDKWRCVMKSLVERGIRRVLLVVHDDFPGLLKLSSSFFPGAYVQLCTVHLLRNARSHLSYKVYKEFKRIFRTIKNSHSYELSLELFDELCSIVEKENPRFSKLLRDKSEFYLSFLRFPEEVRGAICSTNLVESINRKVEDAEQLSGGYFHSLDDLSLKLGIVFRELSSGRWRSPSFKFIHVSHVISELFKTRFENAPESV